MGEISPHARLGELRPPKHLVNCTQYYVSTPTIQWTFPNCNISFIMDQSTNKTTNEWLLQVAYGKTCPTLGALLFAWQQNHSVGCTKSKDRHTVGKSCLFWSLMFATIFPLKNSPNFQSSFWWRRFKSTYTFLTFLFLFFTSASSCLSSFLIPSSFIISCLFSCTWRRKFSVESACVSLFPCVSSYRWIHFPRSVLSVLSTSSVVVHSFLRKRLLLFLWCFFFFFFFFHIHEITRVVVLYASLRLVEGVYKPQRACTGWASVTGSRLEMCMWIKRTCLDEFPPGHPKMFERMLDIISLFVLAISNTISLSPRLGKWYYLTQTVQI